MLKRVRFLTSIYDICHRGVPVLLPLVRRLLMYLLPSEVTSHQRAPRLSLDAPLSVQLGFISRLNRRAPRSAL